MDSLCNRKCAAPREARPDLGQSYFVVSHWFIKCVNMCVSTMYGVLCTLYIYYVKSTICLLYRISKPAKSAYGLQLDFSFSHHKRVQLISLSLFHTGSHHLWWHGKKKLLRKTRASLYPLGLIADAPFFEPLIQCLYIYSIKIAQR